MDNDDKIINNGSMDFTDVHNEVSLLLEKELGEISKYDDGKTYLLESEFEKTRTNSTVFLWRHMWGKLLVCLGVVIATTVLLSSIVSTSNRKIVVEVKEFDNMNLAALLTKVSNIDSKIEEIERQKSGLMKSRSRTIEKIEDKRTDALRLLSIDKTLGKKERTLRETEIEDEYQLDISTLAKFDREIENCNDELKHLQSQRGAFDGDRIAEAEKQKKVLYTERFVHEKEKEKLVQEYEDKLVSMDEILAEAKNDAIERQEKLISETIRSLDPEMPKDSRLAKIIRQSKKYSADYASSSKIEEGASDAFMKTAARQKSYFDDLSYVYRLCEKFPHDKNNAVMTYPKLLMLYAANAKKEFMNASVSEVNRLVLEKRKAVNAKTRIQNEFQAVLENLCHEKVRGTEVDGVVVDINLSQGAKVYLKDIQRLVVTGGEYENCIFPCTVFHEGEKMADAKLLEKDDGIILYDLEYVEGKSISVGDRIIMALPQKSSGVKAENETSEKASAAESSAVND